MKRWTGNIKIPICIENGLINVSLIKAWQEMYFNYKQHYIVLTINLLNNVWLLINTLAQILTASTDLCMILIYSQYVKHNQMHFRLFDILYGSFNMFSNPIVSQIGREVPIYIDNWQLTMSHWLQLHSVYPNSLLHLHYRKIDLRFDHHHIFSVFDLAIWLDQ